MNPWVKLIIRPLFVDNWETKSVKYLLKMTEVDTCSKKFSGLYFFFLNNQEHIFKFNYYDVNRKCVF